MAKLDEEARMSFVPAVPRNPLIRKQVATPANIDLGIGIHHHTGGGELD